MSSQVRKYTKGARAEAEAATRIALLDAAEAAYMSGSWEQSSLEQVAASAGVTKQTLLRNFGSKQGLLEQAYSRGYEEVRSQRLAAPTDDIAGAVDNLLDHYEEFGDRALAVGALSGTGLIDEIGSRARRLHHDWVQHAFRHWLAPMAPADRKKVAAALIALCDVHSWVILSRDLAFPRKHVRDTLVMVIERLLEDES